MYRKRILEINGDESEISLPIVKFPPFNLRALLVEKDPVVWLHCLETYVIYIQYLLHQNNVEKLDNVTYNNLCMFIKSYLAEMAEDEERLLSLGVNHDVSEQLQLLRTCILVFIKKCGLLHLQIYNDSLWDLVKFYVHKNPDTIRSLILGTLKPQINTQKAQLNRVVQIQDCLKQKVESGKFTRVDLKAFEALLSQNSNRANLFPKKFLTTLWIETLETWWAKGKGKFSNIAKELEIVSLISSSSNDILQITKELGISTIDTLILYPLFGSLVQNENFKKRIPDLVAKLPFLQFSASNNKYDSKGPEIAEEDITTLTELFPHLTKEQVVCLLYKYDGNIELATNALLENPDIGDDLTQEKVRDSRIKEDNVASEEVENLISEDTSAKYNRKAIITKRVPDELRNQVLTRALNLLYEKDEDEYDDTYDEVEAATSVQKIPSTYDDDADINKSVTEQSSSKYDQIEGFLWELLKQDNTLFERSKRGTKTRKDIKQKTTWSDEQIEGWARMLERSPHRAKLLEEKYMFKGNVKTGKTSYVENKDNSGAIYSRKNQSKPLRTDNKPQPDKKRQQARNEKQKGSRANHNRKSGHDKKIGKALP